MHTNQLDDNFYQWCNGNYELVYSSLRQLRRYSRKIDPNVALDDDSYKEGFFHRFWNKCTRRHTSKEESPELKDSESDQEVSESEDEDLEELRDPTNDLKLRSSLESLKTAMVECMTRCNFQRPRLIPKRRHGIRKEQLLYYIRSKFEDLLENVEQIEDYSLVCNVDQLLCAELLYEGLFYYGVKDSQKIPEFTIIENMLFRETYFQLRTIRLLFTFINRGEFRTTPTFESDKVFPEAMDILKHLADRGLARNLFVLLLTAINETHKFYRLRGKKVDKKLQREDEDNGFREKPDYDLVFRHNALYLNTVLDVLTSYYMTFSPTQNDFGYVMAFLPHVFDKVKMFGMQEFTNTMVLLFENQPGDDYSAYYPRDTKTSPSWVTPKEFDRELKGNLTCKLCNLLLVMLNTNIYRIDFNLNLVRVQEGFIHIFLMNPHCLFYRGEFDETYDPNFKLSDVKDPELEPEPKYMEKNKLEFERFEPKELKDLEETRENYKQLEVVMDFIMYGSYKNDENKVVEGFSNNVVEVFLDYMEVFQANREKLETNYLKVYKKIVKLLFKPLLTHDENLNKNWFNLLNYELTCKTKLEALAKVEVHEEVNTAIFRDPGTTIIDLLKLFAQVFGERDAEFMFKIYKSISESYNSLMPSKASMLYTQTKKKYNKHYYQVNTRAEALRENAIKNGEYGQFKKTRLYKQLKKEAQEDNITLRGKEIDHMLLFPNQGFTWMERNAALLEMVNVACNNRKILVETYPRLLIQLLEFSLYLSKFPKMAGRLGGFLNSASSKELQVPNLLNKVVNQLKCLNRGDYELLPSLIYEHIIARDDKIEKAETALVIATTVPNENYPNQKSQLPNFENTSEYLQEYFKKKSGLYYPKEEFKEGYFDRWIGLQPKREYLKDVDNYRINVKVEEDEREELYRKPELRKYVRRMYTFPLINTTNDVKKALSNLGLGSELPFGLVEVASIIFRLVVMLDPLVPETRGLGTKENRRRLENRGSEGVKTKVENRLMVDVGEYKYLDVLFTILSNPYVKGTEKLVGSLLKSIASVHVADHKVCKRSLFKVSQLLYEPTSTLGRKLSYYELSSLMYCITVLLMYLPYNLRYKNEEGSESDCLLDLLKYILNILETEASKFKEQSKNKKNNHHHSHQEHENQRENGMYDGRANGNLRLNRKELMDESDESEESETYYYSMMDNIFSFLLILSKGPLGLEKTSRATQYLYEQILLPGSSVAYLLVKCANESKMTTAVSLACNVFKRDFLVHSLQKTSKFNLNKDRKCPNCRMIVQEELRRKRETSSENGKFTWFLNKIHLMGRDKERDRYNYKGSANPKGSSNELGRPDYELGRGNYELEKVEGRVGCEVCCNIDFNQRPLALLQAHEAFLEALSTYSNDLSSEVVGNLSTRNMELRVKTLYILVQLVNRNCKLFLNNKLLTKFKCYLHQSTFTNNLVEVVPEGARYKDRDEGFEEEDFYYVINDVDMESSDLVLYNKLKWLTQSDYDEKASFANLRELSMCTFKTLVTYFFSLEEDLQMKVVDERMFMNMVKTCKGRWEDNSWHKVYLMAIIAKLVKKRSYSRLLLLSWPTIFEEVQEVKFDRNKYNYNTLLYAKMTYQLEVVMNYAEQLNSVYDFLEIEYNPETSGNEGNDFEFRDKLSKEDEEFMNLVDVKKLNYTTLTFRVINNFCEYEEVLYKNLLNRIGKIEMGQLVKAWNFNSYSVFNDKTMIKLVSYHSITTNRDSWFEADREREGRGDDEELEEYTVVVEMYNNYLLSFVALFKRVLRMYEELNLLKFETMFDYVEENYLNYEFKFVLNLIIVKRLYRYNDFNLIIKVLMKLVNYLLETEETHELMRTKIYHLINYFVKLTSDGAGNSGGLRMGEGRRDKVLLPNLIISHLSNSFKPKNILEILFEDCNEDYERYHDLEVLGHMLVPDKIKFQRGEEDEYLEWRDMSRRGKEGDVKYYRYRCIESMYFALEKKDLNCSVEAMKFLSSIIRGLNEFEANRVELDSGRLDYGRVGSVTVENVKNLVNKRILTNFYLCKDCLLTPPLCKLCTEMLVAGLNVLQSVCGLHQFSSFWFSTRVSEHENLSDMFLKSSFLSIFKNKAPTEVLLPTMFVVEHLLSTTSIKTRNSIISWLNKYCEMLLVNANVELEEPEEETKLYLCCLLRVYRITFLWLLSDYRSNNEYKDNFSLILADLHCKFPLASTFPRMVQKLLVYFVSHLDSNLNWLLMLLCLQTFFPELGAFEMDLNFTSQVPIKTKAMELVKLLVEVMLKCSNELLKYIEYYSNFNNYYPYRLSLTDNKEVRKKALEDYELYYNLNLENLNGILTLKVVTLDCCVILLEYILSLVKIPNTVGINTGMPEFSGSGNLVGLKQENLEEVKRVIEKLAKVCTTNGASLHPKGVSRENTVEFLPPYQLEQVLTFYHQFNHTNTTLFSTLLTSLLNLDSILQFYT